MLDQTLLPNSRNQAASDSSATSLDQNECSEPTLKALPKDYYNWIILEGLKDGQRFDDKPDNFTGYMLKRRKRPLKGNQLKILVQVNL